MAILSAAYFTRYIARESTEGLMAFVIAIRTVEGKAAYWAGGSVCSEYGEDAARFMSETDAEATIDILQRAISLSRTARAIDLGEIL